MDYHSLPRRQLQALCKKHGIPANSTNADMAEALTSLLQPKPQSQPEKRTTRSSDKSMNTVDLVSEQQQIETAPKTRQRRGAASTNTGLGLNKSSEDEEQKSASESNLENPTESEVSRSIVLRRGRVKVNSTGDDSSSRRTKSSAGAEDTSMDSSDTVNVQKTCLINAHVDRLKKKKGLVTFSDTVQVKTTEAEADSSEAGVVQLKPERALRNTTRHQVIEPAPATEKVTTRRSGVRKTNSQNIYTHDIEDKPEVSRRLRGSSIKDDKAETNTRASRSRSILHEKENSEEQFADSTQVEFVPTPAENVRRSRRLTMLPTGDNSIQISAEVDMKTSEVSTHVKTERSTRRNRRMTLSSGPAVNAKPGPNSYDNSQYASERQEKQPNERRNLTRKGNDEVISSATAKERVPSRRRETSRSVSSCQQDNETTEKSVDRNEISNQEMSYKPADVEEMHVTEEFVTLSGFSIVEKSSEASLLDNGDNKKQDGVILTEVEEHSRDVDSEKLIEDMDACAGNELDNTTCHISIVLNIEEEAEAEAEIEEPNKSVNQISGSQEEVQDVSFNQEEHCQEHSLLCTGNEDSVQTVACIENQECEVQKEEEEEAEAEIKEPHNEVNDLFCVLIEAENVMLNSEHHYEEHSLSRTNEQEVAEIEESVESETLIQTGFHNEQTDRCLTVYPDYETQEEEVVEAESEEPHSKVNELSGVQTITQDAVFNYVHQSEEYNISCTKVGNEESIETKAFIQSEAHNDHIDLSYVEFQDCKVHEKTEVDHACPIVDFENTITDGGDDNDQQILLSKDNNDTEDSQGVLCDYEAGREALMVVHQLAVNSEQESEVSEGDLYVPEITRTEEETIEYELTKEETPEHEFCGINKLFSEEGTPEHAFCGIKKLFSEGGTAEHEFSGNETLLSEDETREHEFNGIQTLFFEEYEDCQDHCELINLASLFSEEEVPSDVSDVSNKVLETVTEFAETLFSEDETPEHEFSGNETLFSEEETREHEFTGIQTLFSEGYDDCQDQYELIGLKSLFFEEEVPSDVSVVSNEALETAEPSVDGSDEENNEGATHPRPSISQESYDYTTVHEEDSTVESSNVVIEVTKVTCLTSIDSTESVAREQEDEKSTHTKAESDNPNESIDASNEEEMESALGEASIECDEATESTLEISEDNDVNKEAQEEAANMELHDVLEVAASVNNTECSGVEEDEEKCTHKEDECDVHLENTKYADSMHQSDLCDSLIDAFYRLKIDVPSERLSFVELGNITETNVHENNSQSMIDDMAAKEDSMAASIHLDTKLSINTKSNPVGDVEASEELSFTMALQKMVEDLIVMEMEKEEPVKNVGDSQRESQPEINELGLSPNVQLASELHITNELTTEDKEQASEIMSSSSTEVQSPENAELPDCHKQLEMSKAALSQASHVETDEVEAAEEVSLTLTLQKMVEDLILSSKMEPENVKPIQNAELPKSKILPEMNDIKVIDEVEAQCHAAEGNSIVKEVLDEILSGIGSENTSEKQAVNSAPTPPIFVNSELEEKQRSMQQIDLTLKSIRSLREMCFKASSENATPTKRLPPASPANVKRSALKAISSNIGNNPLVSGAAMNTPTAKSNIRYGMDQQHIVATPGRTPFVFKRDLSFHR